MYGDILSMIIYVYHYQVIKPQMHFSLLTHQLKSCIDGAKSFTHKNHQ